MINVSIGFISRGLIYWLVDGTRISDDKRQNDKQKRIRKKDAYCVASDRV